MPRLFMNAEEPFTSYLRAFADSFGFWAWEKWMVQNFSTAILRIFSRRSSVRLHS
jgi:hypothetical protein